MAVRDYYDPVIQVSELECSAALADCLAKGLLQVIDEGAIAGIASALSDGGYLGPIYGRLPEVGAVDFTCAGAELWQQISERHFRDAGAPCVFTDVVHIKSSQFFRSREAATAAIAELTHDWIASVTGPTPIGPWRVQWWRRFAAGYRVDIEERMRWQGRGGGSGGYVLGTPGPKSDPQRLQRALDRHNVSIYEWPFLADLEHGSYSMDASLPRCIANSARRRFGVVVTEAECQSGLEACLRNGWLRLTDQRAVDEVHALLRDDPAIQAVPPDKDSYGQIDFTPRGVLLYRTIAGEWLGPDWEDGLYVYKETYREEHQYCTSEKVLQGAVADYAAKREVIRASRIVPLGPWCVYWWERYAAGYRLELEIGEP